MSDYDPPFHPDHDGDPGFPGDEGEGIYVPPGAEDGEPAEHGAGQVHEHHDEPRPAAHSSGAIDSAERHDGADDRPRSPWGTVDEDERSAASTSHADHTATDSGTYPDLGALTNAGRHAVASAPTDPTPPPAVPEPVSETPPEPAPVTPEPERPAPAEAVEPERPAPAPEPAPTPEVPAPAGPPRAKKPGPKPMTDEPTVRVEGQVYAAQQTAGVATLARLKVENRAVPAAERRRLSINTLIRIGLTVVLEHADELHGKNEAELLESLRAALADSGRNER